MSIFTVIEHAKRRDDVVIAYADELLRDGRFSVPVSERVVWRDVNQAIIDRWSESGLNYIKDRAWQLIT